MGTAKAAATSTATATATTVMATTVMATVVATLVATVVVFFSSFAFEKEEAVVADAEAMRQVPLTRYSTVLPPPPVLGF